MSPTPATPRPRAARPAPARFYRADGWRAEESVGYLMRRVVACLSNSIDRRFEDDDLTHAQWAPLLMIHQGRAGTVAELARECECDAGAMTRMVDRLEAKGLLSRVRSSEDRRVVNIDLTAEGRQIAARVPQVLADTLNDHLAGFSREEWLSLKGYLRRILANADSARGGACPLDEQAQP
jgi:DNA-binding MarR family transcriptional regulator